MKVRCPECGSRGELSAELAEQMVRCPQCGGKFPAQEDLGAEVGAKWYYALGNEKKGPLSEAEFEALVASGVITSDTLVWSKGMVGWQSLLEVRGEHTLLLTQTEQPRKMRVRCPDCGRRGVLNAELVGQIVRCPKCGGQSTATEDSGSETAVSKWYYALGNEKIGPLGEAEFETLIAAGTITTDTLVWCKGMSGWQSLVTVRGEQTLVLAHEELPQEQSVAITPTAEVKPTPVSGPTGWANLRYAGAPKRMAAKIIDLVFMFAWASLVEGLSRKLFPDSFADTSSINSVYLVTLFTCFLLGVFYTTWFVGRFGATPGKMVMNLKIVTPMGGRVSYGQAFGRYWAEFGIEALLLMVGYLPILFDQQRRGLHDRLCGTRVVVM